MDRADWQLETWQPEEQESNEYGLKRSVGNGPACDRPGKTPGRLGKTPGSLPDASGFDRGPARRSSGRHARRTQAAGRFAATGGGPCPDGRLAPASPRLSLLLWATWPGEGRALNSEQTRQAPGARVSGAHALLVTYCFRSTARAPTRGTRKVPERHSWILTQPISSFAYWLTQPISSFE